MNYSMMKEVISMRDGNARQPPELMHYGIKGQKWGIRRFQNEDRTLTEEGKLRYNRSSSNGSKTGKIESRKVKGKDPNDRKNWKKKDVSELSDDELRRRNNRLQAEQNYKNMVTPEWKRIAKQWGREALKAVLVTTVTTIMANKIGDYIRPAIQKNMDKIFKQASNVAISALKNSKKKAASIGASLILQNEIRKR